MKDLTHSEARDLVAQTLATMAEQADYDFGGFVILDEHTMEKPWGWVFFYDSRKHHETGDSKYAIAGNAPYIVNRFDGSLHVTGTAEPTEVYITEYEAQMSAGVRRPTPHAR